MRIFASILFVIALAAFSVSAQQSAFNYQGFLKMNGQPANGTFDMKFGICPGPIGPSSLDVVVPNVTVVNGAYSVNILLDPAIFNVSPKYLDVQVRPTGTTDYVALSPRSQFLATPYAFRATSAQVAEFAQTIGGVFPYQLVLVTDPRLSNARTPLPNSPDYIQNSTTAQSGANFNISGNGVVAGVLTGGAVNAVTQYNIGGQRALYMFSNNVVVGSDAVFNSPSQGNTFIGQAAGRALSGDSNTVVGQDAGRDYVTGNQNAFFGFGAGRNANNGNYNTYVGAETGNGNNSGGNQQTMLGAFANVRSGALTNATAIGFRAAVDTSNSLVLGSSNGVNGATADTNVGIGTSSPGFRLDVAGRMRLQQRTGAVGANDTAGIWFYQRTPNADRAFIGMQDDGKIGFYGNNGGGWGFAMNTATGTSMVNALGAAGSTQLCRNASNEISTCSSSIRYKENIRDFRGGLDLIKRLRPVSFNWKADGKEDLGLVAEEVAETEPLLASRNEKGEVEGVKYDRVGVVAVNAIVEQQAQIDDLKTTVERQKAEIEALKKIVCALAPTAEGCGTPKEK